MSAPVLSVAQMREWEKATWTSGQTEAEVIRRVGEQIAHRARQLTHSGDSILILAGKGHNGDDARAAQSHLSDHRVNALEVKNPDQDFFQLENLLSRRPALVIDGLFGIGLNRPLENPWIKFIQRTNAAHLKILSVDVPSGLSAETGEPQGAAIEATVTLTIGAPKTGLLRQGAWSFVGRLEVANKVGLVPCPHTGELNWTLPEDFSDFPPRRPVASHKGSFGHLAILAGSLGFHGAAVMAARSAQRARPGLITLFTHRAVYLPVAAQLQAVMAHPWSPNIKLSGDFSAVLIGPGLAAPDVPEAMRKSGRQLWQEASVPVIVDASALDWLTPGPAPKNAIRVLTPHPGEAARLIKSTTKQIQEGRPATLRQISKQYGNCRVVLKGHQTLVGRETGEIFVNSSGNPHLAQGGSGDVLSGYLAGLLAQPVLQTDALKTIRFGVWQHGATADLLETQKHNWVVEDLIDVLGTATCLSGGKETRN